MRVSFWRIALAYFGTPFLFGVAFVLDGVTSVQGIKMGFLDYIVGILQMGLIGMIFMSIPAFILSVICYGLSKWLKNMTQVAFIMFFVTFFGLLCLLIAFGARLENIFSSAGTFVVLVVLFPSALISSSLYYFFNRPKKNDPSKIVDE